MIDVFVSRPMAEVLEELPLDSNLKHALLSKSPSGCGPLALLRAVERGNREAAESVCLKLDINPHLFFQTYQQAVTWSDYILKKKTNLGNP